MIMNSSQYKRYECTRKYCIKSELNKPTAQCTKLIAALSFVSATSMHVNQFIYCNGLH